MEAFIDAKGVKRAFHTSGGEFWALKGVDILVPRGKLTILKGKSGSGKTTLLNILGALDQPTAGEVWFDGKNIVKMSESTRARLRRKEIGFVFQTVALIPMMSAQENVEYALRMARSRENWEKRAQECLKMVNLGNRMKHMPQELSGGEQQRVAIAIALANAPKILLADEPTGSVDAKTGAYILDVLRAINRETEITTVIVTHDQTLAKKVNRVVAIRDGKISSERVMKQSYLERWNEIDAMTSAHEVQDEYAILDRAGRLQIPREMLEKMQITGNRVKMEMADGKIILEKPEEEKKENE